MAWMTEVVLTGVAGSPWYNRLYWDESVQLVAQDAADAHAAFWGGVDTQMSGSVTWSTNAEVQQWSTPSVLVGVVSTTISTGSGGGTEITRLPAASQGLVQLRSNNIINNKRVRGRIFIPGLTEEGNENGQMSGAVQVFLQAHADALITNGVQIASRVGNVFVPAVAANVWPQWATLRSRRD